MTNKSNNIVKETVGHSFEFLVCSVYQNQINKTMRSKQISRPFSMYW